jgi:hypothetical protein
VATLLVAAIHNGELASAPAAVTVERISDLVSDSVTLEVSDQAALSTVVDLEELHTWGTTQWALEREWRRYRGVSSMWRQVLAWAGHAWWMTRLRISPNFRESAWRARQIEQRVTRKHVDAWRALVASDCGAALIVESDATWKPDVSNRIVEIVQGIDASTSTYVNLAGGLSERRVRTASLRLGGNHSADELVTYARPVTNTSCAYLITRTLADELLDCLEGSGDRSALGVDWLLNWSFMELSSRGSAIACGHAEPPLLIHGSQSGLTRSWHPAR